MEEVPGWGPETRKGENRKFKPAPYFAVLTTNTWTEVWLSWVFMKPIGKSSFSCYAGGGRAPINFIELVCDFLLLHVCRELM